MQVQVDSSDTSFTAVGRRVVGREAEALAVLAKCLDGSFSEAVALLARTNGRVIVSGIGKSGHIGRKIAATLASTGKPAHFVHSTEASHGDLGMMTTEDIALILSNSGETSEISDFMAYTRRFAIPTIVVSGNRDSTLARQADIALVLPAVEEACDTGIVPTTSTTMMLALGDAIAIALMEHQRFSLELFRNFHPGGKLGSRLLKVRDLMHADSAMPLVMADTAMPDVLIEMTRKGFGVAGILSRSGRLDGIITDGDLRRHMDGLLENTACNVMTLDPLTVGPDALAEEAVRVMNNGKVTCLFVVNPGPGGKVSGILHIHDCLRAGAA